MKRLSVLAAALFSLGLFLAQGTAPAPAYGAEAASVSDGFVLLPGATFEMGSPESSGSGKLTKCATR